MDQMFFLASKFLWGCFSPDIILVFLLCLSLFLLRLKRIKPAVQILTGTVSIILFITVFPIGDLLLTPLENRFPVQKNLPESVDGIIMLAGSENIYHTILWQQVELNSSSERYLGYIRLIKKYPKARHAFIGGTGSVSRQKYKSTQVARQLFKELGIDMHSMIFESESKNTYENAVYAYEKIKPEPGDKWIIVTSASHMPRSVGCFEKAGWQVIPYPVDHLTHKKTALKIRIDFSGNLSRLNFALREWTGLGVYYFTGKTSRFFPGTEKKTIH